MEDHVRLKIPPAARIVRLLSRNRRWGIYYRSLLGDVEGRVEFRHIDPNLLRLDRVDPTDTDAVIAHIEDRLRAAGYDARRRPDERDAVAASWDIDRLGAA